MLFMITFEFGNDVYQDTIRRFLDTQAQPPEGVKMIGRWHVVAGKQGFNLVEADDPTALYRFAAEWSDLIDIDMYPVVDDETAAAVLSDLPMGRFE